ncbi:PEP-utilizing enzyme [Haloplanus aerogenes]|uniref:PEP-utilizing family enzyme n=1 Tax=Haloplanus aerogenes TaxID=660522 RepID=A0A3M0CFS0_9EURY|nr:PEP-utilizing enzyme [Haloplanus aerogenes]AZH26026.1 hypothetical protein DU502_11935 [Haloplanus aerogenes]RMB08242.1 PEP-utilizing family enzyme [Haloplanus aerogenes]
MREFDFQLVSRSYLSTGEFSFHHPDPALAQQGVDGLSRMRLNLQAPPLMLTRNLFECTELLLGTSVHWERSDRAFQLTVEASLGVSSAKRLAEALDSAVRDADGFQGRDSKVVASRETAIDLWTWEVECKQSSGNGRIFEREAGEIIVRSGDDAQVTVLVTSPTEPEISASEAITIDSETAMECATALRQGAQAIRMAQGSKSRTIPWLGSYRGMGVSDGEATGPARVVRTTLGTNSDCSPDDLVGAENIESGEIVVMDQYYHSLRDRLEVAAGYVIEDDVAMTDAGAVLARMYDIPAITTCSGVCRDITTGDRVAVQGGTGILIHEL